MGSADGSADPPGTTWLEREAGDRVDVELCMLSRGDRVWGRCRLRRDGARANGVVLLSPDGCGGGVWYRAAVEAFGSWATVATIDVPLCGRRRSDKLSADGLDPSTALGAQLAQDLSSQLGADLDHLTGLLHARGGPSRERTSVVALGIGAALLAPRLGTVAWPQVVVLADPGDELPPVPAGVRRVALPDEDRAAPFLEDLARYVRGELRSRAG